MVPSLLSFFSSKRLRVDVRVLWAVAAVLAAALVAALLIPRGNSDRKQVESYIEQVNVTGQAFAADYKGVARAYQLFTLAPGRSGQSLTRLQAAARKLT